MRRLLRVLAPRPWRGDLAAAGVVPLTAGVLMAQLRLAWPAGAELGIDLTGAAWIGAMLAGSEVEFGHARSYQVVLWACALALSAVGLDALVRLGGGRFDALTVAWAASVLALLSLVVAWRKNQPPATLVGGAATTVAALAWVDWVTAAPGNGVHRALLLVACLAAVVTSLGLRGRRPGHAAALVNLAGLCATGILVLLVVDSVGSAPIGDHAPRGFEALRIPVALAAVGGGWKALLLVAAFGLIAYAGVDRRAGAGYLGALLLAGTIAVIALSGARNTLVGWPLVLIALGGGVLAVALRPSRPLPPAPDAHAGAPVAGVVRLPARREPPLD